MSIADVARTWYRAPQNLPPDVDKGGLEITAGYRPDPDTGTHSYAAHACVARVDTDTGEVVLEDYVIVEDGGKLLNPMIVDGQVLGGLAQGIGTALYEEMPYDSDGQPLAATLADYLLPGTTDVPDVRLEHMETLSPWTTFGQKGIGESGAIGPPGAIVNAINDALARLGAEVMDLPASPLAGARGHPRCEERQAMKPAAFDYARPKDWSEAVRLIGDGARPGAGTQSLGPLLNLRLSQPGTIADLRHLPDYAGVTLSGDVLRIGAGTTHAAIEDGAVPGRIGEIMAAIARRIAYRPVRNRGTIGGSLAHADPAADWVAVLPALGGTAIALGPKGERRLPLATSSLASSRRRWPATNCCVPSRCRCCRPTAKWGHWKFCRKVGEFSKATACVLSVPGPSRAPCWPRSMGRRWSSRMRRR